MAKDLTVKAIENLTPGPARREVPDGRTRGLYFVLQPSGAGSWAFRYRAVGGKSSKLTLGPWPAIDLKTARQVAGDAAAAVARGEDPAARKREARYAAQQPSREDRDLIENVVESFIDRYAKQNRSWEETARILRREVVGTWRGRQMTELGRSDVHELLDAIVDRGSPIMANRALAAFRRLCNWAVERGIIETSPCEKVRAPVAERSRDRILTDEELRIAWHACRTINWPFGPLIQLLMLTGQRRDEVGEMQWSEIDLQNRTWTIPRERVKNDQAHVVPLSEPAVAILSVLPRIDGKVGYVFTTNGSTPVSGFANAKERIDARILQELSGDVLPRWTLHDLRRTAASGMARLGIAVHVVEAVLNHRSGTIKGVAAVYNRYSYDGEKRKALEAWGRQIDALSAS
jgi:integrase